MKNFRFIIYGNITTQDDVDEDELKEELQDNVGMPFSGIQMGVDEVSLECEDV